MTTQAINGSTVLVIVEDPSTPGTFIPVAEQDKLSSETSRNLVKADSKDSDHTEWIYGKQDDTVSLDAAYIPSDAGYSAIKDAITNKTTITIRRSEGGTAVEEATAFVKSIKNDFPDDDKSTVSIDFQLSTAWTAVV